MSNLIQVTPDELRAKGASFISNSERIGEIVKNLDSLRNEMMEIWKGSASSAFMNQYTDLRPSMDKFTQLVNDIGRQIQDVANTVEQTDRDIANQIGR